MGSDHEKWLKDREEEVEILTRLRRYAREKRIEIEELPEYQELQKKGFQYPVEEIENEDALDIKDEFLSWHWVKENAWRDEFDDLFEDEYLAKKAAEEKKLLEQKKRDLLAKREKEIQKESRESFGKDLKEMKNESGTEAAPQKEEISKANTRKNSIVAASIVTRFSNLKETSIGASIVKRFSNLKRMAGTGVGLGAGLGLGAAVNKFKKHRTYAVDDDDNSHSGKSAEKESGKDNKSEKAVEKESGEDQPKQNSAGTLKDLTGDEKASTDGISFPDETAKNNTDNLKEMDYTPSKNEPEEASESYPRMGQDVEFDDITETDCEEGKHEKDEGSN